MGHTKKYRSKSKARTLRHTQKGGDLSGNPASAWGWGLGTLGNGWTQFMNSLTLQPGQNLGTIQSNNIVPVKNINAQDAQPYLKPNLTGGKRRAHRKHHNSSKKGGSIASIIGDAIVPFSLLAAQNSFGKGRGHTSSKSRKYRYKRN